MIKKDKNNLERLRHTASHVLAQAVLEMFPEAKLAIGPVIENGFYYDFDLPRTLIPEDLEIIEKKMKHIIKQNLQVKPEKLERKKALAFLKKIKQPYKIKLIKELKDKQISFFRQGDFVDLCKGYHLDSTGEIPAFKLLKISGAYWKGDEKNKMLQRIYGTAFYSQKEIDEYQKNLEEAKKRDHKKIGKELDLFSFHSESPGSPYWHPNGMIIWSELEKLGKGLRKKYAFIEVQTPILAKSILWKTSGHWDHYKNEMFTFKVDKETYVMKPMDCPFNIQIYKTKIRSYKDLPIRYTEIGRVFRNEKSGELNGLFRVQHITQDDAHVFVTEDQVEFEISRLIRMVKEYYGIFKIKPEFFFSTRPKDFMGDIKSWDRAEKNLENALRKEKVEYKIKEKDGAFYGPKIDIDIKDALGRQWQLATIQLDFQIPKRFAVEYITKEGKRKTPIMIHAAIFGSFERFIGILIEHFAGVFPLWLAPVQVVVLPISGKKHLIYAKGVVKELRDNNIRVEIDDRTESVGKKIRESEIQKNPYVIIVGDKEKKNNSVAVRSYKDGDLGSQKIKGFIKKLFEEINNKR